MLEETRLRAQEQQQLIEEAQYTSEVKEQQLAEFEVEVRKQMEQAQPLLDEAQEHDRYAAEELE